MNNITRKEYIKEIEELATCLVDDARDELDDLNDLVNRENVMDWIMDNALHEAIDGHQWIIYYTYNDDVLRYTSNVGAYEDAYDNESLGELVKEKGFDGAKMMMAYYAMYNDVLEQLEEAIEDKFSEQDEQ